MQIHRIVLGLDVLGNPVSVVRGVVEGTFDLFYEPIKVCVCHSLMVPFGWCIYSTVCVCVCVCVQGSVLGPQEFAEGLGIGLRSFVGGTFGTYAHPPTHTHYTS